MNSLLPLLPLVAEGWSPPWLEQAIDPLWIRRPRGEECFAHVAAGHHDHAAAAQAAAAETLRCCIVAQSQDVAASGAANGSSSCWDDLRKYENCCQQVGGSSSSASGHPSAASKASLSQWVMEEVLKMPETDRQCEETRTSWTTPKGSNIAGLSAEPLQECKWAPAGSVTYEEPGGWSLRVTPGDPYTVVPFSEAHSFLRRTIDLLAWVRGSNVSVNVSRLGASLGGPRGALLLVAKSQPGRKGGTVSDLAAGNGDLSMHMVPPVFPVLGRVADPRPSFYFLVLDSLTRSKVKGDMPLMKGIFESQFATHEPMTFDAFHSIAPHTYSAVFPFLYGGMDANSACSVARTYNMPNLAPYIEGCVDPKRRLYRELRKAGYRTGVSTAFAASANIPVSFFRTTDLDFYTPFPPCDHFRKRAAQCGELRCFANGRFADHIFNYNKKALEAGGELGPPVALWSHLQGAHVHLSGNQLRNLDSYVSRHLLELLADAERGPEHARLGNTVIVVLGDHGDETVPCANSRPFLGILAPRSLGDRLDIMKQNVRRLVSMWDLRATVRHLAGVSRSTEDGDHFDVAGLKGYMRGRSGEEEIRIHPFRNDNSWRPMIPTAKFSPRSLASVIRADRGCAQAGIAAIHCSLGVDPRKRFALACVPRENITKLTLQTLGLEGLKSVDDLPGAQDGSSIDVEYACSFGRAQANIILASANAHLDARAPGECKRLHLGNVEMIYVDTYLHVFFSTVEGLPPRLFRLTMGRVPADRPDGTTTLQEFKVTEQQTRWSKYADCMPAGVDPEWCVCSYWNE
eukprot:TRINITY_DN74298_c0_g1_i1.p1 TRINITY_DN74298_c0_g1~~TRINITY_DN74298_c0_g1_i1.p1  ORF type:complete len:799 (-),score=95.94 TRINITY_DN74298_c0_g1_i1:519-2915(-)